MKKKAKPLNVRARCAMSLGRFRPCSEYTPRRACFISGISQAHRAWTVKGAHQGGICRSAKQTSGEIESRPLIEWGVRRFSTKPLFHKLAQELAKSADLPGRMARGDGHAQPGGFPRHRGVANRGDKEAFIGQQLRSLNRSLGIPDDDGNDGALDFSPRKKAPASESRSDSNYPAACACAFHRRERASVPRPQAPRPRARVGAP